MNSWSAIEVFVVALGACSSNIEEFAQYVVGDKCDHLNEYLSRYVMDEVDAKCFTESVQLLDGYWILVAVALLHSIASWTVLHMTQVALRERVIDLREYVSEGSSRSDLSQHRHISGSHARSSSEGQTVSCTWLFFQ